MGRPAFYNKFGEWRLSVADLSGALILRPGAFPVQPILEWSRGSRPGMSEENPEKSTSHIKRLNQSIAHL